MVTRRKKRKLKTLKRKGRKSKHFIIRARRNKTFRGGVMDIPGEDRRDPSAYIYSKHTQKENEGHDKMQQFNNKHKDNVPKLDYIYKDAWDIIIENDKFKIKNGYKYDYKTNYDNYDKLLDTLEGLERNKSDLQKQNSLKKWFFSSPYQKQIDETLRNIYDTDNKTTEFTSFLSKLNKILEELGKYLNHNQNILNRFFTNNLHNYSNYDDLVEILKELLTVLYEVYNFIRTSFNFIDIPIITGFTSDKEITKDEFIDSILNYYQFLKLIGMYYNTLKTIEPAIKKYRISKVDNYRAVTQTINFKPSIVGGYR